MKIAIEISDTLKQIADEEDFKTFSHFMWQTIDNAKTIIDADRSE